MVDELKMPAAEPQITTAALRALEQTAIMDRALLARRMGMTFGVKRDMWAILGYKDVITATDYRDKYERGGIAGRVVDALAKAVWRGDGDIFEDNNPETKTEFEKAWYDLNDQHQVWSTLMRAHILASLGSFSAILLGAPGELNTVLPRGRVGQLLYMTPFGGGVIDSTNTQATRRSSSTVGADVTVQEWDNDARSPRFGQPTMYKLLRTNLSTPDLQKPIHWTRLVHIPAPGFLDDAIFGPPALKCVWNYLDDLDKVVGGGSEAFWLRANQGLHLDIDPKLDLADAVNTVDELKKQADNYAHQMTRMIRTRGVTIDTLGSDVANFKDPADAILTLIAGTCGIPKRILTGSEMGQLASTQDADNWDTQVDDCRTNYAHPVVLRRFIGRLIDYGYLPKPAQWSPKWPDSQELTEPEKMGLAEKASKLNNGGMVVVTAAEVREYLGKEPLTPAEIDAETNTNPDTAQVDQLAAALRNGGTLSLAIK